MHPKQRLRLANFWIRKSNEKSLIIRALTIFEQVNQVDFFKAMNEINANNWIDPRLGGIGTVLEENSTKFPELFKKFAAYTALGFYNSEPHPCGHHYCMGQYLIQEKYPDLDFFAYYLKRMNGKLYFHDESDPKNIDNEFIRQVLEKLLPIKAQVKKIEIWRATFDQLPQNLLRYQHIEHLKFVNCQLSQTAKALEKEFDIPVRVVNKKE